MNHISSKTHSTAAEPSQGQTAMAGAHASKGELVVKGVATAVAAAAIIETGKGVMATLAKQPLVMFGLGIAAVFLTHKYRKEILLITGKTAEQSKDFVLRQQEHLKDMLAESRQDAEDTDSVK